MGECAVDVRTKGEFKGRSCDEGCKSCGAYEWTHRCERTGNDRTGILDIGIALGDVLCARGIEMGTHIHGRGFPAFVPTTHSVRPSFRSPATARGRGAPKTAASTTSALLATGGLSPGGASDPLG